MSFHLCAFAQSQDTAAVLTRVNAVRDTILFSSGVDLRVANFVQFLGAHASGVSITRAQLQSPSLRRLVQPEVRPISRGGLSPLSPPALMSRFFSPIVLDLNEALNVAVAEDAVGADQEDVLVWLADAPVAPVTGPITTVRGTLAVTLVAHTWTAGDITLDQTLPAGKYQVVGARLESATIIGFRFVFRASSPRPGGLGALNAQALDIPAQRMGGWGVWGQFDDFALPSVEMLASGADAAETIFLDLIKVG